MIPPAPCPNLACTGMEMPAGNTVAAPSHTDHEWKSVWLRRVTIESIGQQSLRFPDGDRSSKLARLEAALFVADQAFTARRLAQLATLADAAEVRELIRGLNAAFDADQSAFRIEEVASGYRLLTRPEFSPWLSKLHERQARVRLSPAAMETLTIIAYRQPIIRADVEAIRGVQASEMIKQLMERGLVRISGEDDSLGRPYLYSTTRTFLEEFGLQSLDKLPMADDLRRPAGQPVNEQGSEEVDEEASITDNPSESDEDSTDAQEVHLDDELELEDADELEDHAEEDEYDDEFEDEDAEYDEEEYEDEWEVDDDSESQEGEEAA